MHSPPACSLPSNIIKCPPYHRQPPSSLCMHACPSQSRQPYTLRELIVTVMYLKIHLSRPGAEGIHPPHMRGLIMIQHVSTCLECCKTHGWIRLDVNVPLFVACCSVPAFLISRSLAWQFLYVGMAIVSFTYYYALCE